MICCAVGTCAITERKREKNSVQTSNSKLLKRAMTFSAIISACSNRSVRAARRSTISTIWLGIEPAQLIVALAADAEELDFLAFAHERAGALARQPHDGGVERPAQAAFGGADQKQMHVSLPVPRSSRGAVSLSPTDAAMLPSTLSICVA